MPSESGPLTMPDPSLLAGILLAVANSPRYLDAAGVLAEAHLYPPAVAHLVYSIEESEKARRLDRCNWATR